jgi:membrane-associated phospholipid phosphatase
MKSGEGQEASSQTGVSGNGGGASPGRLWQGWRLSLVPLLLLAAAAIALAVDCPLARWCLDGNCPRFLSRVFDVAEPFGNGLGAVFILLAVFVLDRERRWSLPRAITMSLGAGMAANAVKLLVARIRPYRFSFDGPVGDTFGQWLPLFSAGSIGQSFPSSHTATAIGLAVALGWLYPRGRWLFATLALLVACQRVQAGAHFLSDALSGAAVGWLVAVACLRSARFDRWERRWKTRLAPTADSAAPLDAGPSAGSGDPRGTGASEPPARAA